MAASGTASTPASRRLRHVHGHFASPVAASAGVMARAQATTAFSMRTTTRAAGVPSTREESWAAAETAIIVCDMWDLHHCLNATRRGTELCPRLERVLCTARAAGATIIHAPSDCLDFYTATEARARAVATPTAPDSPSGLADGVQKLPSEPGDAGDGYGGPGGYPIDQRDGGEDDDPMEHAAWAGQLKAAGKNPGARTS